MRIEAVAVNELRDGDVALGVQRGKQIKSLEHETDFVPAQFGARGVAHLGEVVAVHEDVAARGLRKAADHVEQRRLSASRRAHDRNRFAGRNLEIDAAQRRALPLCPRDTASTVLRF